MIISTSATQMLCWLLPYLQKHENNELVMEGVSSTEWQEATGEDWKRFYSIASDQQSYHP